MPYEAEKRRALSHEQFFWISRFLDTVPGSLSNASLKSCTYMSTAVTKIIYVKFFI